MGTGNQTPSDAPKQSSKTEATGRAALLDAVEAVLSAQGPRLDPVVAAAIRAAVRVDVPPAQERRHLGAYWRGVGLRHGLRAAERASGISRYHILLAICDMQPNPMVWAALGANQFRGDALDSEEPKP